MKSNPSVIARETLLKLAELQLQPTPDNYHRIYSEVAGIPDCRMTVSTSKLLVSFANELPRHTKELSNFAEQLLSAANKMNWQAYKTILLGLVASQSITDQRKRTESDSAEKSAIETTDEVSISETDVGLSSENISEPDNQQHSKSVLNDFTDDLLELLVHMLEQIASIKNDDSILNDKAKSLVQTATQAIQNKQGMMQFIADSRQFFDKFGYSAENGALMQQSLLGLLDKLLESTGHLFSEDQWYKDRISKLRETIAPPLNKRLIVEAEGFLDEIVQRQHVTRLNLGDTRETLAKMVTYLIDNIDEFSDETGVYQDKIEGYSEQISNTEDWSKLNQLIIKIVEDTQKMHASTESYRKEFISARAEVEAAQEKIIELESELQHMSEKVHEDPMTGVLNRRGLDSVFSREVARASRQQLPICYALLDIDNFKAVNDQYGHHVGDEAIVYLVNAVKKVIRGEDVVARYGGEEFVILLPNTALKEAIEVLARIRRDMTKQFFLHENKKLLVTFSAGVAEYKAGESQGDVFKRADEALYRAKKSGKNLILEAAA